MYEDIEGRIDTRIVVTTNDDTYDGAQRWKLSRRQTIDVDLKN